MLKHLGKFSFIVAFGLLIVQPAAAQPSDAHTVTVNVRPIEDITVTGEPEVLVGSGELRSWVEGNGNGSLEITSNIHSGRKVTVKGTSIDNGDKNGNIGLRVRAVNDEEGGDLTEIGQEEVSTSNTDILGGSGDDELEGASSLITGGFETVYEEEIDLQYEAWVNEDYDPNNRTRVRVRYTLQAN
ncbi:hypothetical protein [Salinibacter ruber]|uniref:hypothetical protein n=1 Tax=Salinibacter ruber TaxID=146919 RepID=UPI000C9F4883|nr:hypothetical protein [Salinibacter ruber]MCS3613454.1 hypothetical protein [Salinibacter ruber]MCS3648153.1 hypothetical protein [Salinibacter ruber]